MEQLPSGSARGSDLDFASAPWPSKLGVLRGALAAGLWVGIGVLLGLWLQPVLDATVPLLLAVLMAAWFSGFWPAILASLLATLALDYFFTPPLYTLTLELARVPHLLAFMLIAGVIASASAARRRAERSLAKARDELDAKVRERTAALQAAHADAVAAQERLRASEEQWKAVFENNPTMYFMVDAAGTVLSVNPYGAQQLGYTVDQLVGQSVLQVFAEAERPIVRRTIAACLQQLGRVMTWEIRKIRRDGSVIWVHETAKAMARTIGDPVVLVACEDITARKRAEQEREELAGRLIHAQEEERRRIGRELHDHISQMLGVLSIGIDQLRGDAGTPPPVASVLEDLKQRASEITADIHSLSHRLHSSALDYLGLVPALQRLIGEFSARHGIQVAFTHEALPTPLPSDVALCLFRVTEEGLTNIARHSHAKSARVHAIGRADGVVLIVEDTGDGFDLDSLTARAGLGFVSMRERLRALCGTVRVESALGRGTTIEVWIPASAIAPAAPHASST